MVTLRKRWEKLTAGLRGKASAIGVPAESINPGRIGIRPGAPPFLWIFVLPQETPEGVVGGLSGQIEADVTIFCAVPSQEEQHLAVCEAYELAVRVIDVLDSAVYLDPKIFLDEVSVDYAVARVECTTEVRLS